MKIKLCGIRRPTDIEYVNEFLPDYIGFVFAKSNRQVNEKECLDLSKKLNPKIKTVGVFVNEDIDKLIETVLYTNLDVVQLHGDESKNYILSLKNKLKKYPELKKVLIWKAIRVQSISDLDYIDNLCVDCFLLDSFSKDSYGGTGKTIDLDLLNSNKIKSNFFLAGGLNASNIENILSQIEPYGVDISSGIETNGFKDRNKIENIINCIRRI